MARTYISHLREKLDLLSIMLFNCLAAMSNTRGALSIFLDVRSELKTIFSDNESFCLILRSLFGILLVSNHSTFVLGGRLLNFLDRELLTIFSLNRLLLGGLVCRIIAS